MDDKDALEAPITRSEPDDEPREQNFPYREVIGSLIYAAVSTRIDISFSVAKASRQVSPPTKSDWKDVERIFKYLKTRENYGITYSAKNNQGLVTYCDADFAGDIKSARSTTGLLIMFAGAPIHWRSQKQNLITLSSTEAELVSLCQATKDTICMRNLSIETGIISKDPTLILCDNQSAIHIAQNDRSVNKTRHIRARAKFPQEKVEEKEIRIKHIKSQQQLADVLKKPPRSNALKKTRIALCPVTSSSRYWH